MMNQSSNNQKNLVKSSSEFQSLQNQAEVIAQNLGLILYDIEFSHGSQGQVLRIYIDKNAGGISVDDCADFSRGLNDYLDQNDPFPQSNYSLEVSSPGVDRPLKHLWHFEKVIGQKITLKTEKSLENYGCEDDRYKNSKSITDDLVAVDNGMVVVKVGDSQVKLPLAEIEKAKVAFVFNDKGNDKNPKNKQKNKKAK